MKRLTARNKRGIAYYPTCVSEEKKDCKNQCYGCLFDAQVCHRLAEYEDLGVTPEQIRKIDELYSAKCRQVALLEDINNRKFELLEREQKLILLYKEKVQEVEFLKMVTRWQKAKIEDAIDAMCKGEVWDGDIKLHNNNRGL